MNTKTLVVVAILLAPVTLVAKDKGKLEGEYELAQSVSSTGIPRPDKSTLHVRFTGDVAKTLYESSPAKPSKNECTGYIHKASGDFDCYEVSAGKSYACTFAINLEKSAVELNSAC